MSSVRRYVQRSVLIAACFTAACGSSSKQEESDPDQAAPKRAKSKERPVEDKPVEPSGAAGAKASMPAGADLERVLIPFLASVNGERLECGKLYDGLGVMRSAIELRDFRFYVHDLELIDAGGKGTPVRIDDDGEFQMRYSKPDGSEGGLALIDFATEDSELCSERGTEATHTYVAGRAPAGKYEKLAFTIGVPQELNHVHGAASQAPLNAYGMQWSWASGYRHMKLDVRTTTEGTVNETYYFHPGATGCRSDSGAISGNFTCDNAMTVRVTMPFTPGKEAVEADVARLYANSDLSHGRGCMGTSTLGDDTNPTIPVKTGCAQIWETLGLRLPSALANKPETLGKCSSATKECRKNEDCGSGAECVGYVAAVKASRPELVQQTVFANIAHNAEISPQGERPEVSKLADDSPAGWPHPDYERDPELEESDMSIRNGTRSHEPGDERFGSNCLRCHQEFGPGSGQYALGGTVLKADGAPFSAGGVVQLGTGIANRNGPTLHPIADRIRNFEALVEVPIDRYGQFFATADQLPELDYGKRNYLARIVGTAGSCKSPIGELVKVSGEAVSCKSDDDCSALRFTAPGMCQGKDGNVMMNGDDVMRCMQTSDCGTGDASCFGAGVNATPRCDKLLNAMPVETTGACNHCHGDGFRIRSVPTL